MAQIIRSSIIQWMIDLLGLQPSSQTVPLALNGTVQPVVEIGPRHTRISRFNFSSTTGTGTLYTTPTDKDFYITYVSLTVTQDATCDGVVGTVQLVQDGVTRGLIAIPHQALTAGTYTLSLSFPYPIKVDRNTAITAVTTFTAGTCSRYATLGGFVLE